MFNMLGMMFNYIFRLFKGSEAKFIFAIIFNWYIVITSAGMLACYYFLKGLKDSGALDKIQNFIFPILNNSVLITKECSIHILDLRLLYECLQAHTKIY